jgi:hypothetical protein
MVSRWLCIFATGLLLVWVPALNAQAPTYKPVGVPIAGVSVGEFVEAKGYAWITPGGSRAFVNFNEPSARVPTSVDLTNVPVEVLNRFKAECSKLPRFPGGCAVIMRGQTGMIENKIGLFAHEIEILPK